MGPSGGHEATETDRRPILSVTHWILTVLMCIAAVTKLATKWALIRNLQLDDAFTIAAMLFSVGYGVATTAEISYGTGHRDPNGPSQRYMKAGYVSEIFYTFSLVFAKLVVLQIFLTLSRNSARKRPVYGVMVFTILWTLAMVFPISFQCSLPSPWDFISSKCFAKESFWQAFATLDVLIDVSCGVLSVLLFYDLNMVLKAKIAVTLAFAARLSLIPVIVIRLVHLRQAFQSHDRPFADFYLVLLTSLHVNMSVLVTCIPFLKPIINGIQSGILAGDIRSLATIDSNYFFTSSRRMKANWGESEDSTAMKKLKSINTKESTQRLRSESEEKMVIRETREIDIEVKTGPRSTPDNSDIVPGFLQ